MSARAREKARKAMANHLVDLASLASQDLALFLDRKVSAPPEIAPDRPEVLPDCIRTIATRKMARITIIIETMSIAIFIELIVPFH